MTTVRPLVTGPADRYPQPPYGPTRTSSSDGYILLAEGGHIELSPPPDGFLLRSPLTIGGTVRQVQFRPGGVPYDPGNG